MIVFENHFLVNFNLCLSAFIGKIHLINIVLLCCLIKLTIFNLLQKFLILVQLFDETKNNTR